MEIILKQDVPNLGHKDDLVTVRNGYATNYLIPQGYATLATPSAKKMHAENLKQRAHKDAKIREEAQALAAKLEGVQVTLATKVSSTGKIFGSVNNIQVAEALAAKGFEIDRRNITIQGEEAVKEVGVYEAVVKCHRDIKANIKIEVIAEE
ncbi:MAG: 50S ribosomal protein L9 [Bacteroidales bacterium]|jgi:large subunit ribosomal protein L9|nr:50S ribosomal protein L9 [Bacteroidales bacterium]MDD3300358.1 50S ribosomal protein L9 [Bacteroidales bacterium]MDD3844006.1 50S ribosomal protein L9 [Bacteroidales bacterium]MDD4618833.1 50S ribosomal protein L9 [Bacteroidales bacterium]